MQSCVSDDRDVVFQLGTLRGVRLLLRGEAPLIDLVEDNML